MRRHRHSDCAAAWRVLERVREQVDDDLTETIRIAVDDDGDHRRRKCQTGVFEARPKGVDGILGDLGNVDRCSEQVETSGLRARESFEILDHPLEAEHLFVE